MAAKVLIVEDNDDCRTMMATFLGRLGYSVMEAENGLEGLEKAVSWQPQLIFMDLRMPMMDGFEATSLIKDNPSTKHIPVVIYTAFDGTVYHNTNLLDYAADILQKPVGLARIQTVLRKYLPPPV